jgi:YidC/Oxa1 family membrane protein insertase
MNDIRRTILWVIFGFSMVMLWDQWQVANGKKATFFPSPATQASAAKTGDQPQNAAQIPASGGATQANPATISAATPAVPKERFEVTTDVLKMTFDSEGGSLVRTEFLKHVDLSDKTKNVVLLEDGKDRFYKAQSGLLAQTAGTELPNHTTAMAFSGERELKEGANELTVKFTSPDVGGVRLVKTYTIKRGAYDIAVKHEVLNTGTAPVSPKLYVQLVRDGGVPLSNVPAPTVLQWFGVKNMPSFSSTFTGVAVYTDAKKYQNFDFSKIKKPKTADFEKQSDNGFVAMVQHYFTSAWILPNGVQRENALESVDFVGTAIPDCCYRTSMTVSLEPLAPGASKAIDATLYTGPQDEKVLEALAPGLERVKDYGWLTIIAKPLYWLLDKLHATIGNWGWSIIALVLLLKIAFYWLNAKAYSSMAKMKAINPKIMEMRERLKDKPQQMQQEMMRIYREEKVNPMGGCFPIMIQIPVFIALYSVLLATVEMRNAPWALWIHDLSAPDPYYILPLFMTLTTLLQTSLNPAPPDPMQAKMMWIMPLAFSVMFFFFPSGLVMYWITNNVLSIAQQWIINTRMGVPPKFNLPKF